MTDDDPKARLTNIRTRIARAATLAGRPADAARLIAVSKTRTPEEVEPLIAADQRLFGENRVQEAEAKWPTLRERYPDIELHLIGQLQSNKASAAVSLFDAIHTVDRPSLIEALARAVQAAGKAPRCLLQVNIGDEPQKGGCAIDNLPRTLAQARDAGLTIGGLMAIPPADVEAAPYFALLAKLAGDHGLTELSMGMSDDFETAVMLGATTVRVGTALFGARA